MRNFIYKTRKALWPKLVILCYHRIENYMSDPVKITVSNNNFLKQINFLKEFANIIKPDQLFESLKKRKNLPRRSVLLTFDDGYSSYKQTMDLLLKESISAIFFISLRKEKYWWDILTKILFENQDVESDHNADNKDVSKDHQEVISFNLVEQGEVVVTNTCVKHRDERFKDTLVGAFA